MNARSVVGIDEAGRGPLAGPVAVGAAMVRGDRLKVSGFKKWCKGLKDSKKLSEKKREEWFEKMKVAEREGWLTFAVVMVSAREIDRHGIAPSISRALTQALTKLNADPAHTLVLLDGGLKAPEEFAFQKTIIKGDEKESIISLASIAAKVSRDRLLKCLAKRYPGYGLEVHKGYGTAAHRSAMRRHGLSAIHRKSFCRNLRFAKK